MSATGRIETRSIREPVRSIRLVAMSILERTDGRAHSKARTARVPGYDIGPLAEVVDDLALAFVAPLGADNDPDRHLIPL